MKYKIVHSTRFVYQGWVGSSHNLIRIKPRDTLIQTLSEFDLELFPTPAELIPYEDFFNNHLYHILVREPHNTLSVTAHSIVTLDPEAMEGLELSRDEVRSLSYHQAMERMNLLTSDILEAKQFALKSPALAIATEEMVRYASESIQPNRSLYEGVEEFMSRIFHDFEFVSGFSDISTPVEKVFLEKKGVCQDFSHFAITALRGMGLCVRYMSGYIETLPPEGEEKLFGADASHAWFAVFFPGFGWFEFDPTNNIVPTNQHIVLGFGRDYNDVAPMQGVIHGNGLNRLEVAVDVRRIE
ncbi:MAG: transglutaminase N-terminal domain-containing protein [Sulfuricurvum sp.]